MCKVKVKAAVSGLFDTDAYRHIVSLPLTEFTPSPEALHTKHNLSHVPCPKAGTWDRLFYFPSEGRHAVDFSNRKNQTASVGSEPAILGTRGKF
jgi:hypothetical protein